MIIEHRGCRPAIHPRALVSPAATVSGDVTIGPGSVVLAGAVLTSEGAPVHVGPESLVMEHAVLRGAGPHPCVVGTRVLIGPHAHISGAEVGDDCFIATGAAVLNAAAVGRGTTIAVHGIVHIATRVAPNAFVPIGHIAVGDPAKVFGPTEADGAHRAVFDIGFTRVVFGFDSSAMTNADATREALRRYLPSLAHHAFDREIHPGAAKP